MATHLEESLQRDINLIRGKVLEMCGLAEAALRKSLKAFLNRDLQSAYSVILRDKNIDELEKEIDRLCLEFLVRQQPVAGHLRFVYATIKINAELERIGDYAESIARQVLKLNTAELKIPFDKFVEIANLSIPMLQDAIKAFVNQNADLAGATMITEEKVDDLRNDINADLMTAREKGLIPLEALTPLLTIARRYERVSDQAKNICEEVLYMCTGEYSKHKGTEVLRILFVDRHNSCRSQMAEAIARSLQTTNLVFNSAGLRPQPMDPRTVDFLAKKGIETAMQASKSIEQVPNLEHYQIIVALDPEARKVFPSPPTKTVTLDWTLNDPSQAQGSVEEVRAAYEQAYQFIKQNLQKLVEAIVGDKVD
ncbi:MAG: phoU 1 [Verrucomicrobiales bacterium]|nr:phoU 1 [Verrucomicrobiales bacterium]